MMLNHNELINAQDVVDDKIMYSYSYYTYYYDYYYYYYNSDASYSYSYSYSYDYYYYSGAMTTGPMALALLVPAITSLLM